MYVYRKYKQAGEKKITKEHVVFKKSISLITKMPNVRNN